MRPASLFVGFFVACSLTLLTATVTLAQPDAFAWHSVIVRVVDHDSGQPLAARLYLRDDEGKAYYFQSLAPDGSALKYEKQNWNNKDSTEYHTTISPHAARATVPAGSYMLTVERGKSWFPVQREFRVTDADVELPPVRLRRWIDMAERGWYSGDLHLHRSPQELRNVVLAENLNVAMPLTYWVTLADTPPSAGNKNQQGSVPEQLIRVSEQHLIWPRNTEYEIFTVNEQRHTLGALFVLGHQQPLQQTVPPWQDVIDDARQADPLVLFDMDKLAWPFAMTLPVLAPDATYELANNHMWRTEFAFREWYTPTPSYMQPPWGGTEGGESEWIDFTLGMYYTLLNAGFRLPPSAGTANGVHPVPAGFGRVYVHQPDGFGFDAWRQALKAGRSFVTTGPMLFASADDQIAGHHFQFDSAAEAMVTVQAEVVSETPVTFGEVIVNGQPQHLLRVRQQQTDAGAWRGVVQQQVPVDHSGWIAVRFFEDRPGGRVRFAHTAPWYVTVADQPVKPSWAEKQYLVRRMKDEIQRSRGVVSPAALQEYERALQHYESLQVVDEQSRVAGNARPLTEDRQRWLDNMIIHHRFGADEVRAATGMSIEQAHQAIRQRMSESSSASNDEVKVLPYPGGRHPRRGFLDGAIDPQRETKLSVFAPWKEAGYAVVDVPEAIFSNLGLTYLAHTHVPTIWTERSIELQPLEWQQTEDGYRIERTLPNDIRFTSEATPADSGVTMRMSLTNGTDQTLTEMRSQVCVMLKGLHGFNSQRRRESVEQGPFIAVKADRHDRWVITAWQPHHRSWANPPVPCIHSDPIFPDCEPGQTVQVHGGLWFYEGDDVAAEIERLTEVLNAQVNGNVTNE